MTRGIFFSKCLFVLQAYCSVPELPSLSVPFDLRAAMVHPADCLADLGQAKECGLEELIPVTEEALHGTRLSIMVQGFPGQQMAPRCESAICVLSGACHADVQGAWGHWESFNFLEFPFVCLLLFCVFFWHSDVDEMEAPMPQGHDRKAYRRPHMSVVEVQRLKCNALHHWRPALGLGERPSSSKTLLAPPSGVV